MEKLIWQESITFYLEGETSTVTKRVVARDDIEAKEKTWYLILEDYKRPKIKKPKLTMIYCESKIVSDFEEMD